MQSTNQNICVLGILSHFFYHSTFCIVTVVIFKKKLEKRTKLNEIITLIEISLLLWKKKIVLFNKLRSYFKTKNGTWGNKRKMDQSKIFIKIEL